MSILFSGDFHANAVNELGSITKSALVKSHLSEKYNTIKYHIILGDGGFLWPGNTKTDLHNFKVLANRAFPILCVIGNHEPILGMKNVPQVDIGIGETVYQIHDKPFTAYLKRGKVYNIDGFKVLVLGGALSIDKILRKPGLSWWENEYWSEQEKKDVFKLLEAENDFDCVFSHTGPQHINQKLFNLRSSSYSQKFRDEVAFLNDEIHKRIQFKEWWCGHWHRDMYYYDDDNKQGYRYLYRTTNILDRLDNELVVYNSNRNDEKEQDFSIQ